MLEIAEITQPVAELPAANIHPAGQWPEDQFVNVRNVPIFAEHETTSAKTGRQLQFGPAELQAVADRCNRRIRETGDYSAITLGHTPDSESGGAMPEVVGYAGPFRLGVLPDGRRTILADWHVFREDWPRLKKHPRRSPELWVEDRYEDMILDPICCLGAEAPRLDMGMFYSARNRDGAVIERYSAAFAGPLSVDIRGETTGRAPDKYQSTPEPNAKEKPTMALDENDIRQIVSALEQLDWVQFVKTQMQAKTAPGSDEPDPALEPSPSDMPPGGPPSDEPAPQPEASGVPPREGQPEPHARPRSGVNGLRYALRMQAEVEKARRRADEALALAQAEQGKRVDLERYQKLSLLRDSHGFDLDDEFETVRYGKVSDTEFETHCQRIERNYTRIPTGMSLPIPESAPPATSQPGGKRSMERYAKEAVNKAVAYCKAERLAGREPDYKQALAKAHAGEI